MRQRSDIKKMSPTRRAANDLLTNSVALRRLRDGLWKNARTSGMLSTAKTSPTGGVTRRRSPRLLRPATYQIVASSAALKIAKEVEQGLADFAISYTSTTSTPCMPVLTEGAISAMEQALCAYAQEIKLKAARATKAINKQKRVTSDMMEIAIRNVEATVFGGGGDLHHAPLVLPPPLAAKPRKKAAPEENATETPVESGASVAVE